MAYTPFQDGTQKFGIPDSPVEINSVEYIAEDIQFQHPSSIVEINNEDGVPIGQVVIPKNSTGTAKLQFADDATPAPPRMEIMTLLGVTWVVTEVGEAYTQGQYAYSNISFRLVLNP